MAKHDDNLDLVKLFGLSREEAEGLGLDGSALPPIAAGSDGTDVAGLPEHAEPAAPAPVAMAAQAPEPSDLVAMPAPAPADAEQARIAEDIALLAMLNGLEAPDEYSGHGASRGLALALEVTETPPSRPTSSEVTAAQEPGDDAADDGARFVVADVDDDVDVVGIFDLSADEALGLGLAPSTSLEAANSLEGPPAEQARTAEDTLRPNGSFPTMFLHATGALGSPGAADVGDVGATGNPITAAAEAAAAAQYDMSETTWAAMPSPNDEAMGAGEATTASIDAPAQPRVASAADPGDEESSMASLRAVESPGEPVNPHDGAPVGDGMADRESSTTPIAVAEGEIWGGARVDERNGPGGSSRPGSVDDTVRELDTALVEAFAEESVELLDGLHVELEHLERNQNDRDALLETRRIVHTLKGGAKLCGFEQVVTLTHSCENLLDLISEGVTRLDAGALHALFACEPLLRTAVQNALLGNVDEVKGLADLAAYFDTLRSAAQPAAHHEAPTTDDADEAPASSPRDEPSPEPAEAVAPRQARLVNTQVTISDTGDERLAAPEAPAVAEARPAGRRTTNSLHVDLAKVDAVVAKVTEMAAHRVSSQGMMGQLMEATEEARRNTTRLHMLAVQLGNEAAAHQPHTPIRDDELGLESYSNLNTLALQLQEAVSDQQALIQSIHDTITSHWRLKATESRIDADIQSALMNIRLIPIANMRVRLDGVVRQAAQATGKMVRWQLQGGAAAVEKNVFDRLFEPLMHLLRNAIDHGIESPTTRLDAGKAESGSITVSATQDGNQIVIAVSDDGAGIVPNRVASLAVERGLVSAAEANSMTPQQKISLIFTPGFSTAEEVSHISGRGVGMDVVRETCLRMGGAIDVHSRPGLGTTITMRLPLSLSVARGLIVRDGGCLMALPVSQISALHLVSATDMIHTSLGRMARIEGQELPIYNLPPLPGARTASYVRNGEVHVLQVPHEGGSIGIVIEDVLDEEEILIKAPPALLRHVTALLGAYVLPDGSVAPVINMPQMLADLRPVATLTPPREESKAQERTALIVDDSMSMRVALSGTLQSAGFSVLTARDGQEALDVLKREGLPSLITLDIEMPRMDGLETLFAIRQMPGAQELPVFMMTSRGGAKHRRAADQLGATRYFTKPYRDSELASAARAAIGE